MHKLIIAAVLSSFSLNLLGASWEQVDEKIAAEYPSVAVISGQQLLEAMQQPGFAALLFDVREPAEFAVSHLAHSSNRTTARGIAAIVHDTDVPIIVYCSVGYRSAGVAAELQNMGYTNVRNLHHSLFDWANNGYPMVNSAGLTLYVHPFNRTWGALLEQSLRRYTPH